MQMRWVGNVGRGSSSVICHRGGWGRGDAGTDAVVWCGVLWMAGTRKRLRHLRFRRRCRVGVRSVRSVWSAGCMFASAE